MHALFMTRTDILEDVMEDVGMLNFSYAGPNSTPASFKGCREENRKPGNSVAPECQLTSLGGVGGRKGPGLGLGLRAILAGMFYAVE